MVVRKVKSVTGGVGNIDPRSVVDVDMNTMTTGHPRTPSTRATTNATRRPGGRAKPKTRYAGAMPHMQPTRQQQPVMREHIGDVLRTIRRRQGRTLREVSAEAQVSLGYLSEVERGQKEASSELLYAICRALGVPLSLVLREVSDRIAVVEGIAVPDIVPDDLVEDQIVATS